MNDTVWKGVLLSFVLYIIYLFLLVRVIISDIHFPNGMGLILLFCCWIPQLLYSLPILAVLRRKNLPKTHFGFQVIFVVLLLFSIAMLVFVVRGGA